MLKAMLRNKMLKNQRRKKLRNRRKLYGPKILISKIRDQDLTLRDGFLKIREKEKVKGEKIKE